MARFSSISFASGFRGGRRLASVLMKDVSLFSCELTVALTSDSAEERFLRVRFLRVVELFSCSTFSSAYRRCGELSSALLADVSCRTSGKWLCNPPSQGGRGLAAEPFAETSLSGREVYFLTVFDERDRLFGLRCSSGCKSVLRLEYDLVRYPTFPGEKRDASFARTTRRMFLRDILIMR